MKSVERKKKKNQRYIKEDSRIVKYYTFEKKKIQDLLLLFALLRSSTSSRFRDSPIFDESFPCSKLDNHLTNG